ncbi:MAG: GNAT family N-acetyltransferase [Verrucomicrobiales bacterium]|nr:GNAT family N-acetyltransferase [Verrucomicrobiales bacterium]
MKHQWLLRECTSNDQDFLWEMLYEALWDAPNERRRPRSVLQEPAIRRFVEYWGRPEDYGLIAYKEDGTEVGAIWTRLDGYDRSDGFGCGYPCIGIAVVDSYQGKGLGKALLGHLITSLRGRADGLRLGVNPMNTPAIALYRKFGFTEYATGGGNYPQMKLSI